MDLKNLTKKELVKLIKKAKKELKKRPYDIGDYIVIEIEYMVGDANGTHSTDMEVEICDQDAIDALNIFSYIMKHETSSLGKGSSYFKLNSYNFSQRENKEPYALLYDQDNAPTEYFGITLNENILNYLIDFEEELFRDENHYGGLLFESISITLQ